MNVWTDTVWKSIYEKSDVRSGIYLKSEKNVDAEVKRACKAFCKWLRTRYSFPIRVPIYLKASYQIKTLDGDMVSGTFFEPTDMFVEPYIRVATGDYEDLKTTYGKERALAAILHTIAHELTHYFQWINRIKLTEIGYERQARRYADLIIDEYWITREYL